MPIRLILASLAVLALCSASSCGPRQSRQGAGAPRTSVAVDTEPGLHELDPGNKLLGNLRAVVVLVDFADAPVDKDTYPPERLAAFMFDREAKGLGQCVAENSGGRYTIDGEVFGWYRSRYTVEELNATPGGVNVALDRLAKEVVLRVLKERIDPAAFDNDGPDGVPRSKGSRDDDGLVDELYIVFTGPLNCGYGLMGRYADFARRTTFLALTTGEGGFGVTGYYLHELGHFMYLARDHYGNHFQGEYGIGIWGMMGLGCWGQRGDIARDRIWTRPAHYMAFHKIIMGWVEPRVLTESTADVRLTAMEVRPDCVEIPIPGTLEYFLVENRQPIGFEDELPGGGLLITRCTRTWRGFFWLVQADGRDDLQHGHPVGRPYPPTTENIGDAGDPFPGSTSNRHFDPKTTPNTNTLIGLDSGITIRGISPPGETMSFDLVIDDEVQEGLKNTTTVHGCLDELQVPNVVRRRNAALSLVDIAELTGGLDDRPAQALIGALNDADRKVRLHAARALGRLAPTAAIMPLAEVAEHGDPEQAAAAIEALGRIAPNTTGGQRLEAIAPMVAALESGAREVRTAALEAVAQLGDTAFEQPFVDALDDRAIAAQCAAAEGLGRMKAKDAVARLVVVARDEARGVTVRVAAIDALGRIGHEPAAVGLHALLRADEYAVREATIRALGDIGSADSIAPLIDALADPEINDGNRRHGDLRADVAEALAAIGPEAFDPLVAFVETEQAPLESKSHAATALGLLGDPAAVDAIVRTVLSIRVEPDDDAATRELKQGVRDELAEQARKLVEQAPHNGTVNGLQGARASLRLLVSLGATWLGEQDAARRIEGVHLLERAATAPVPDALLDALGDCHPDVRAAAAEALGQLKDVRALPGLIELLGDQYATVREAAADALGELADGRAVDALAERMAREPNRRVEVAVVRALASIGTPETADPLLHALVGTDYEARVEAARGLGKHNRPDVVAALIAALPDTDYGVIISPRWSTAYMPRLRICAMRALAEIGDASSADAIRPYLESDDLSSRLPAALALMRLAGTSTNGKSWPEVVHMLDEYIQSTTGRELFDFVPHEYLRE